jgi:uncharacterized protein (TIGR03000 family)
MYRSTGIPIVLAGAGFLMLLTATSGNAQMYGRIMATPYGYAPADLPAAPSPYYGTGGYPLNGYPPGYYSSWAQGNLPTYMTSINYPTIYGRFGYQFAPGRFTYGATQSSYSTAPTLYGVYGAFDPSTMSTVYLLDSAATSLATTANVEVRLPVADAALRFQGVWTAPTGRSRRFVTPSLVPGNNYSYDISATWTGNHGELTRNRYVELRAGDQVVVDFATGEEITGGTTATLRARPTPRQQ